MTLPVWYPPDLSVHLVSVYREGRRFSPPRDEVVAAFLTILAREAEWFDIRIHAWSLMGSHPHVWVSDADPTQPSQVGRFRQVVNSVFGKWLSDFWRSEGIWDGGHVFSKDVRPAAIKIVDATTEAELFAYIYANPVAAGITLDPTDLKGATSTPECLFEPLVVERPSRWFRKEKWPDKATIQLEVPPKALAAGYTRESWFEEVSTLGANLRAKAEAQADFDAEQRLKEAREETPEEVHRPGWVNHSVAELSGNDPVELARCYLRQRRFRRAYCRNGEQQRIEPREVTYPFGTDRMVNSFGYAMRSEVAAKAG